MRRDRITCSVKGCDERHEETRFNEGHPGWGHVVGIVDEHGEMPHLCPKHMATIKELLNGELD